MRQENDTMDRVSRFSRITTKAVALLAVSLMIFAAPWSARAETAKEIDLSVDVSLESFAKEVKGAKEFLQASKGVLVFPRVYKAGFWLGGEYGEGALRIEGKTADYYNIAAGCSDSTPARRSRP